MPQVDPQVTQVGSQFTQLDSQATQVVDSWAIRAVSAGTRASVGTAEALADMVAADTADRIHVANGPDGLQQSAIVSARRKP